MRRSKRETGNLKVGIRKGEASCLEGQKEGWWWVGGTCKQASEQAAASTRRTAGIKSDL